MSQTVVAGGVRVTCTERPDDWPLSDLSSGDFSSGLLSGGQLTWLNQSHGSVTVTVTSPGFGAGALADAAVTTCEGAQLLIRTADCAPIVLRGITDDGAPVLGVAHAGWTGLMAGICESVVRSMRALGAEQIQAQIGPCIGPECYEFGVDDLARIAGRFGPSVIASTSWDTSALDLSQAATQALLGVEVHAQKMPGWMCTACEPERLYSHRARRDVGRLGLVAEIVSAAPEASCLRVD